MAHARPEQGGHLHLIISERVNDGIDRTREMWFSRAATSPRKRDKETGKLNAPKQVNPGKGGARKTDKLKPIEWLDQLREDWEQLANRALEAIRKRGANRPAQTAEQ